MRNFVFNRGKISLALLLVIAACGGSGNGSTTNPADVTDSTTNNDSAVVSTDDFKFQTDEETTVAAVMGNDELTLTTTSPIEVPGSDYGAEITLVVPAGAVPAGTEISIKPIVAVYAFDRTWKVLAGAEFSPDGLQFSTPGTLSISLPTTVGGQFSMITQSGGVVDKFGLEQGLDFLSTPIKHFSSMAIVPDALSDYDATISGDPAQFRQNQITILKENIGENQFGEAATQLIDAVNETLTGQFKDWWFGSEKARTIGKELVEGLIRTSTLCPKDADKMKAAMKQAIEIGIDAGLDLQGWTSTRVDGLFKECDRYTVVLDGRVAITTINGTVSQTVKSTIVVNGGEPLNSFGEGILFSQLTGPSSDLQWDEGLLRNVNNARAEFGDPPCEAHTIPGTVQVASLDTTSEEGLNYVDLSLWDAVHDWGGPFLCESLDGGWAMLADSLTSLGKTNSFRIVLDPFRDGWKGDIEANESMAAGTFEMLLKVAVVRTPGARLTEPGGRGHAVGVEYPYYDHYHYEQDENRDWIVTAWDSSNNSTVVFNISDDRTDGYSDLDQGWDGEWDLPLEDPFEDDADPYWEDSNYWEEEWWPIEEWPEDAQSSIELEIPIDDGTSTTSPDDTYPDDSENDNGSVTPDTEPTDE